MGKQPLRITLFSLICLSIPVMASAQVVFIPDFNLRGVIQNKLGKVPGTTITVADMARITDLDATKRNIHNLTGLEHATNLIRLWLPENNITDLRPLAGLTQLEELALWTNSISNLRPLAGLINLRGLYLRNNYISDLSPLAGLTNLRLLDLGENSISNISALAGLFNLTELWIDNNSISDLWPLVENTGLKNGDKLNVMGNPLSALSFNSHIPTLQSRGVNVEFDILAAPVNIPDPNLRNAIKQVLGKARGATITVAEMEQLTVFDAPSRHITNLTGLEHAINLRELGLARNNITDISPLAGLTNLTFLHLRNNFISNISPIARLTRLTFLHIGTNRISNISSLAGLTHLTALGAGHNNITDISPLARLTNLARIGLHNNTISNISPLAGLTQLTELHLDNNSISDLWDLVENTGLGNGDSVAVRGNPLSTLSFNSYIPTLQSRGVSVTFDEIVTQPADVNGDGVVNIFDLVSVVSHLGKQGQNLAEDVNGDGIVNILDLVSVAGMFEDAAAAPAAQLQAPETITAAEVHGWLTNARSLEINDPITKRGIMVLEQLLKSITPTETTLLPNYPNPFNPETWIPYRLAEGAFVTLTIYDRAGQVVRTIDVGHQIAAFYESRSQAIYWDGRNESGEKVASGVYFYHLSASDFSATRKMLILK